MHTEMFLSTTKQNLFLSVLNYINHAHLKTNKRFMQAIKGLNLTY